MKNAITNVLVAACICLLSALVLAGSVNRDDRRAEADLGISVEARGIPTWREFNVRIPKDAIRKKGVQDVIFILGKDGARDPVQARVPVVLRDQDDGDRFARVYLGPDQIQNAFLEVTYCPGPKAPLMCIFLRLADYVKDETEKEKRPSQQSLPADAEDGAAEG